MVKTTCLKGFLPNVRELTRYLVTFNQFLSESRRDRSGFGTAFEMVSLEIKFKKRKD